MAEPTKDTQCRKWQLTLNNPADHGWPHERIRELMRIEFPSVEYWCMADEIGGETQTLHTHFYAKFKSPVRFSTLKMLFPEWHLEKVRGTSHQNRDYVTKTGKWLGTEKGTTSIPDTFEEFGECPVEAQGQDSAYDRVYEMLKDNSTNLEILDAVPSALKFIDKIERTRSIIRDSDFAEKWRDLTVTYVFGATGSGKTRTIMETYGYANCYRVTDYTHPFDSYDGQDVIIFEEFRGGLKHGDMLNYLDGYPIQLPCRYFNRPACYTKVFIVTNVPPDMQYVNVDAESRKAFFRRIHRVVMYTGPGESLQYPSVASYLHCHDWVKDVEVDDTWAAEQLEM